MLTGTHFNYYQICRRKLWLFANGINMEHSSDLVYEGKLIHENTYTYRSERFKEIELGGIKIDYYDPKEKVVHEVKKSDSYNIAHIWQLKYYLFILEQNGVEGVTGILEYPQLRKTETVTLSAEDRDNITKMIAEIENIISAETCPSRLLQQKCRNCSYFDFCWSGEVDEIQT